MKRFCNFQEHVLAFVPEWCVGACTSTCSVHFKFKACALLFCPPEVHLLDGDVRGR